MVTKTYYTEISENPVSGVLGLAHILVGEKPYGDGITILKIQKFLGAFVSLHIAMNGTVYDCKCDSWMNVSLYLMNWYHFGHAN